MESKEIGTRASTLSLGIMVIVLYALFVSLVAFGFGSYIYRTGWQMEGAQSAAVSPTSAQTLDIDNIIFIVQREDALEELRQGVLQEISMQASEVSSTEARHRQSFAQIREKLTETLLQLQLTMEEMSQYRDALSGDMRRQYDSIANTEIGDVADLEMLRDNPHATVLDGKLRALLRVVSAGFAQGEVDASLSDAFDAFATRTTQRFDALKAERQEINDVAHEVRGEVDQAKIRKAELEAVRDQYASVIAGLREKLPPASVERARLSALTLSLPFVPNILMQLVSFPTIFLTLIVTIAAGGLGTVVAFSRRYYSNSAAEDLTLSRLFVNVGEGIAAAIAIFLFSGAGMLALTQGGGGANNVELSPYTVAFIAFLSGFMAEDAFASIQAAGKRIFNTEEDDPDKKLVEAKAILAKDKEDRAAARAAEAVADSPP